MALEKLVPVRRARGVRGASCCGRVEYYWEGLGWQYIDKVEEQQEDAKDHSRRWRHTRFYWFVLHLPGAYDGVSISSSAVRSGLHSFIYIPIVRKI